MTPEDAMLTGEPRLAYSLLMVALHLRLPHPKKVTDDVERPHREGRAPRLCRGLRPSGPELARVCAWPRLEEGPPLLTLAKRIAFGATAPDPRLSSAARARSALSAQHWRVSSAAVGSIASGGSWCSPLRACPPPEPARGAGVGLEGFVNAAEWVMVSNVIAMGVDADGARGDQAARCRLDLPAAHERLLPLHTTTPTPAHGLGCLSVRCAVLDVP